MAYPVAWPTGGTARSSMNTLRTANGAERLSRMLVQILTVVLLCSITAWGTAVAQNPRIYSYVTGDQPYGSDLAYMFTGWSVTGTFVYDTTVPPTGTVVNSPAAGATVYVGALTALTGTVMGGAFSDPVGRIVVGDDKYTNAIPASDVLVLAGDPGRQGALPSEVFDFDGFEIDGYTLQNARLFWIEGMLGAGDFLTGQGLPEELPAFDGRLALDFVVTGTTEPLMSVFFDLLRVSSGGAAVPFADAGRVVGTNQLGVLRWDGNVGRFRYVRVDISSGMILTNSLLGSATLIPKAFLTMPDITGDGIGDFAFLAVDESGGPYPAFVRDGATGGWWRKVLYGVGDGFAWFDLVAVGGATGPGTWGLGAHGRNALDGRNRIQVKDPISTALIANVDMSRQYIPFKAVTLPDRNGNGVEEIASLGISAGNRSLIQVKDGATAEALGRTYVAQPYVPVDFAVVPDMNGNGHPEFAILAKPPGDVRLLFKDSDTGEVVANRRFDTAFDPISIVYVPDAGSGPAFGVLGRHSDGRVRLTLQDAQTYAFLRHMFFDKAYTPKAVVVLPDTDGGGADDVAVVGMGEAQDVRVQVKDVATATQLLNIQVP